ncbi:hypothetical protein [Haloferula sp. BvORR071]|uniref:hypothetical protein n=1 Tax=Haloferula sp. BvORR071 TaxID=1396141 RepID=UPI000553B826|nr:hypothetical protein [Haloferula sp. BvORR071]
MDIPSIEDIVVADKDADFDKLLRRSALITVFLTARDSDRLWAKSDRLRQQIEDACRGVFGVQDMEPHVYISDNWWPDHTRHIEVSAESFQQPLFEALRALLVAEFGEWRIQVVVYRDPMAGTTMIGSVLIWSDKLIIDRALYDWMYDGRFELPPGVEPRFFSLERDDLESPRYNLMNDPV